MGRKPSSMNCQAISPLLTFDGHEGRRHLGARVRLTASSSLLWRDVRMVGSTGLSAAEPRIGAVGKAAVAETREMTEAVLSEYRHVRGRIIEQREQVGRLRALVERLEEQVARDERFLAELENACGMSDQLRIEELDPVLRGERLREVALEVLAEVVGPGQEIHYRDWFGLVRRAGHQIGGRDPLATFLAQVNRAEGVVAIGRRSGLYRLAA